jgi:TolA-binding protein
MDWVLLALLLGSVIYSAKIVMDFFECQSETLPKITRLEELAESLVSERKSESVVHDASRTRLTQMREAIAALEEQGDNLKKEMIEQQILQNRLQLETNRQILRESKKVMAG